MPQYQKNEAKQWAKEKMKGLFPSLTTPFRADGEIDEVGFRKNIRHCIKLGLPGLYVGSAFGEFTALTLTERKRLHSIAVEEGKGKLVVVVQTGSTCAKDVVELSKHAEEIGADAVMVVAPYYQCKAEEAAYQFFKYVADRVNIGMAFYHTTVSGPILSPEFIARLSKDIPNICAIKNGIVNFEHTLKVAELAGDLIAVGEPSVHLWLLAQAFTDKVPLSLGAPEPYLLQVPSKPELNKCIDLAVRGKFKEALRTYYTALGPIRKLYDEVFFRSFKTGIYPIAAIKYWAERFGMAGGAVRPPYLPVTEEDMKLIDEGLEKQGLLLVAPPLS